MGGLVGGKMGLSLFCKTAKRAHRGSFALASGWRHGCCGTRAHAHRSARPDAAHVRALRWALWRFGPSILLFVPNPDLNFFSFRTVDRSSASGDVRGRGQRSDVYHTHALVMSALSHVCALSYIPSFGPNPNLDFLFSLIQHRR